MTRFSKFLTGWLPRAARGNLHDTLHSADRMRAILDRERMKCDRGRSSFALLTFTFSPGPDHSVFVTLGRILHNRIRATDDAGFLEPQCVGVLLPETSADGAWKLSEDVCEMLPADMPRPQCGVYVYPSSWGEPRGIANGHVEWSRMRDSAAANGHRDGGQRDPGRRARPMGVFFVQTLPAWKRALDVLCSGTGLLLLSPLFLVVAAAVKLTSRGPIFYAQQRDGLGGRKFRIYKFRSMVCDAEVQKARLRSISEQDGPAFKLRNDPRVTRLGRFLRRTCIDELPQLFNVLMGDMTLVGPRPMCSKEASQCDAWQRRRLDVMPGLTCTWQIEGGTKVTFAEWMRMDLRYVGSRSFWKDLRLIVLTVPSIIRRDGVY
jgi:lipopolysaccharide/colanic/teichoic acid biosynthesis glycosyltransferase